MGFSLKQIRHLLRLLCCFFVLALFSQYAFTQGFQGTIRGDVQDQTGGAIAGATVTVTNDQTGESRTQQTTSAGTFEFPNLLVSTYSVKVEAPGFKAYVRRDVLVKANQTIQVAAKLEVGEVATVLEVSGGSEMVQTTSSQLVGASFGREVTELPNPTVEGNPLNLAILAPGTTTQPGGVAGIGGSIGGNRPRNNNFVVDGLDNNDPSVTGPISPVIQESIEEFTLLTNQFNAEYGHSTAGQFIMVTKSGTNELHGRGWWHLQNRNLNSLDNITRATTSPGQPAPRYDYNRFGGQAGGPILKNKWFIFGSFEYRNQGQAGTASGEILVPTAAGLSTLRSLASNPATGVSQTTVGILSNNVPTAAAARRTTDVLNEATGQRVPIELGAFSATTPQFDRTHLFVVSSDVVTARHRFSGRVSYSRDRFITEGNLPVAQFNSNRVFDTRRVTFSDAFTIRPTVVNEFRLAYLRSISAAPVALPPPPGRTDVFGNYAIVDQSLFIGPRSNFPQTSFNNIYQISEQISFLRGKHTIKGGVDVRSTIATSQFLPRERGEFNYASLDEFVRDRFPSVVSIRGVGQSGFAQNRPALYWFIQDTWKVHPHVTLELGIRYEWTGTARDSNLQVLNAFASIPQLSADPRFATLPPGHQALLRSYLGDKVIFRNPKSDKNNFGPRIGLAWDPFGTGKTSVRAGFSIAHDVIFGNLPLLQLPPQAQGENRETNACILNPRPAWCALVPSGTSPRDADIRASTTGFLAGGGLLRALPTAVREDVNVARALSGNLVLDDRAPETYNWSLSVQHQLFNDLMIEGRYVGNHVVKLPVQRWANAGVPNPFRLPIFINPAEALAANFNGRPTLADFLGARGLLLQPFGFNGVLTMFTPDGQSWYHGASVAVTKRMSRGISFNANYTFSRTIDVIENELFTSLLNPRRPFNHLDIFSNKGLSGLHRKHKFVMAWVWDLPKFEGANAVTRKAVGGWQLSGSYIAESGQPITVISNRDLNGDFDTAGDTAFLNPNGRRNTGTDVNFICFNNGVVSIAGSAAGCAPGQPTAVQNSRVVGYVAQDPNAQYIRGGVGAVANVGRGTISAPGINVWNLGIFKQTPVWGEGRYVQFRMEMFNAFNHPNFTLGGGGVSQITARSTNFPGFATPGTSQFLDKNILSGGLGQAPFQRVIQFGLKFIF